MDEYLVSFTDMIKSSIIQEIMKTANTTAVKRSFSKNDLRNILEGSNHRASQDFDDQWRQHQIDLAVDAGDKDRFLELTGGNQHV